ILSAPSNRKPLHWPSILMVVLGLGGVLLMLGVAAVGLLGGVFALFNPAADSTDAPQLFSYTVGGVFLCMLLLPSIVLGIQRLSGRDEEDLSPIWGRIFRALHPKKLIWLYPFVILAGWWINRFPAVNWLFMPVLNMFALSLPGVWLLWVGTRKFEHRSSQRKWGALGLGLTIGPWTIFVLEILAMVMFLILGITLMTNTVLGQDILNILQDFGTTGSVSEQEIFELLQSPLVIGLLLAFISGIVPIVEETIKPVAVWLLWGRDLTLQDGWALGLLSGGGFALLENFGNVAVGEGWTFVALARAGATALHMFNTGLIGYTFVLARKKKRILPPFLALAAAILVHAVWNAMTVFATVESLAQPANTAVWSTRFIVLMVLVSLSLMAGIFLINRKLSNLKSDNPATETAEPDADQNSSPVNSSPEIKKTE
ncbi:MAG: PrsW family glutamic-type intramembrane protease, partial [Anaerolineales bacterium]